MILEPVIGYAFVHRSSTPVSLKQVTQLLQTCLRELLATVSDAMTLRRRQRRVFQRALQEHNDAYAHSVASAVAAAAGQGSAQQQVDAVRTTPALAMAKLSDASFIPGCVHSQHHPSVRLSRPPLQLHLPTTCSRHHRRRLG